MPENFKTNTINSAHGETQSTTNPNGGLASKLAEILDNFNLYTKPNQVSEYCVEGIMPQAVAFPNTIEQLASVLKISNENGASVIARGSGTKMSFGRVPNAVDVVLSTSRLHRVIDHDAANLTVTVQTGIKLADLQKSLSSKRQFVPLGASTLRPSGLNESATVGGILSTNSSGPKRLLYGSARDFVLGMKVALPNGKIIKTGGKTVKNVAGYDMCKLFIGSLGTLGVIVEATLRLLPLPESSGTVIAGFAKLEGCMNSVAKILDSPLIPSAITVLDSKAITRIGELTDISLFQDAFNLVISAEGFTESVQRQLSEIESLCKGEGTGEIKRFDSEEEHKIWQNISNLTMVVSCSSLPSVMVEPLQKRVVCKISVPISTVGKIISSCHAVRNDGIKSLFDKLDFSIVAYAGSGIVYVVIDLNSSPVLEDVAHAIESLRMFANQFDGSLLIEHGPAYIKKVVEVWDKPGKTFKIMQSLKSSFDPKGILNPGRFIGGL